MKEFGSWAVTFKDGTTLGEYDSHSPLAHKESGEVPFRAIDWANAESLILDSQWARTTFQLHDIPEGKGRRLMRRTIMNIDGSKGVRVFILMLVSAGEEPAANNVSEAIYWLPDGTTHECVHFDCKDVRDYINNWMKGDGKTLMPHTRILVTQVDAEVQ